MVVLLSLDLSLFPPSLLPALLENVSNDALDEMFDHFPLFDKTLPSHWALQQRHQSHTAKSAKNLLTVWVELLYVRSGQWAMYVWYTLQLPTPIQLWTPSTLLKNYPHFLIIMYCIYVQLKQCSQAFLFNLVYKKAVFPNF